MTENESKYGNIAIIGGGRGSGRTLKAHLDILQELEEYRAIGTVRQVQDFITDWRQFRELGNLEEFKALKEKSVAKKPYIQQIVKDFREHDCYECPNCDCFVGYVSECQEEHYQYIYCPNCGQKLDWQ